MVNLDNYFYEWAYNIIIFDRKRFFNYFWFFRILSWYQFELFFFLFLCSTIIISKQLTRSAIQGQNPLKIYHHMWNFLEVDYDILDILIDKKTNLFRNCFEILITSIKIFHYKVYHRYHNLKLVKSIGFSNPEILTTINFYKSTNFYN